MMVCETEEQHRKQNIIITLTHFSMVGMKIMKTTKQNQMDGSHVNVHNLSLTFHVISLYFTTQTHHAPLR